MFVHKKMHFARARRKAMFVKYVNSPHKSKSGMISGTEAIWKCAKKALQNETLVKQVIKSIKKL